MSSSTVASFVDREGPALQLMLQDVTKCKQFEEQLRNFQRAVEQSPVTIVITDTAGRIEYANPKLTEITGYTLEEAIGQTPSLFKSGETTREEYARLWATICAGGEWRGVFHNRKRTGSYTRRRRRFPRCAMPRG